MFYIDYLSLTLTLTLATHSLMTHYIAFLHMQKNNILKIV